MNKKPKAIYILFFVAILFLSRLYFYEDTKAVDVEFFDITLVDKNNKRIVLASKDHITTQIVSKLVSNILANHQKQIGIPINTNSLHDIVYYLERLVFDHITVGIGPYGIIFDQLTSDEESQAYDLLHKTPKEEKALYKKREKLLDDAVRIRLNKALDLYKENKLVNADIGKLSLLIIEDDFKFLSLNIANEFVKNLKKEDQDYIKSFKEFANEQRELYYDEINSLNLNSLLRIRICNNKDVALLKTSFNIYGFKYNRSTPLPIVRGVDLSESQTTDLIIEPKSCSVVGTTSLFMFYHKYEIHNIKGVWQK